MDRYNYIVPGRRGVLVALDLDWCKHDCAVIYVLHCTQVTNALTALAALKDRPTLPAEAIIFVATHLLDNARTEHELLLVKEMSPQSVLAELEQISEECAPHSQTP